MGGIAAELLGRRLGREEGPLYRQLAAALRAPLRNGRWAVGTALPTEAALARQFAVSLITVRHALRILASEGLIEKRAAKTAIVAAPRPGGRPDAALNSLADIIASAADGRFAIASYRRERAPAANAALGLAEDVACYCLRGVMHVAGRPRSQNTIYFPPAIGRRLARTDFDDVVVFRAVERHLGIRPSGARLTVSAALADAPLARALGCARGAPILVVQMLYLDGEGTPTEFTIARFRADAFSLTYEIPRPELPRP